MKDVQVFGSRSLGEGAAAWGRLLLLLLVVVASLLVLAGCRTYGRYDAKEKMLPQLQQAVRAFGEDLQRARAEQVLLRRAAPGDSALRGVAREFDRAVKRHEQVLEENRRILSRYEDDLGSYRDMHRIYGAILSEHEAVRNRYRSLIRAVRYPGVTQSLEAPIGRPGDPPRRALPDTLPRTRAENFTEGRYYLAPIFYNQLQSAGSALTMRQALAERKSRQSRPGGAGRQRNPEETVLPDTSSADTTATSISRFHAQSARRLAHGVSRRADALH